MCRSWLGYRLMYLYDLLLLTCREELIIITINFRETEVYSFYHSITFFVYCIAMLFCVFLCRLVYYCAIQVILLLFFSLIDLPPIRALRTRGNL